MAEAATPQNIVIGGAAGAIPPLAGWAAASGRVGLGAVSLFVIVLRGRRRTSGRSPCCWSASYAAADVPMLPVVRGVAATARQILAYSVALTLLTLAPGVLGTFGGGLSRCGGRARLCPLSLAVRLWRRPSPAAASALFHFSLLYLALLFVAAAVGAGVR